MVSQLVRHSVQRLTMVRGNPFNYDVISFISFQSFLTLPLEDAAQRVDLSGSSEMEKMLRDMVRLCHTLTFMSVFLS